MTWFKVDDSFHSHPKVLATDPAALGLWVLAGSWSSAHLTEGVVRDDVLPRLLPDADTLARKLVAAGLWKRIRGGYQFHDWLDRNPTREAVAADRKANADRQKRWREAQRNAVTDTVTNAVSNGSPTRPDPTRPKDTKTPSSLKPRTRGTRIPDDFRVTPEMVTWSRTEVPGVDGKRETEKFVNHWRSAPGQKGVKLDWSATWRNWMLTAAERQQGRAPMNGRNNGQDIDWDAAMQRAAAREGTGA